MSQNSRPKIRSVRSNASRLSSLTIDSEFYVPYGDDETLYRPSDPMPLIGKFAKLKYGDDKELIFNIDCQGQNILDYFRKTCRDIVKDDQIVDIVDVNGNLKDIRYKMTEYCTDILEPRKVYILVEIITSEFKNHFTDKIKLLLYKSQLLTNEFDKKISQYSKNKMRSINHSRIKKIFPDSKLPKLEFATKHKNSIIPALISPNNKSGTLRRKTLPTNSAI